MSTARPSYRLPQGLWLCGRYLVVSRVTADQMRDVVADQDGALGAWDRDTETIYVARGLPPAQAARVYAHELLHALVDLLDP